MADFLASFNLAPEPAAPSNARSCASLTEFQTQLRNLVAANVTPTRSTHISTALQIRDSARFELNFADPGNEPLASLASLDPSLVGVVRSTPVGGEAGEAGANIRVVDAAETLKNQPHSDPVLQKGVAKNIAAAVGEADSSIWTIREVSRQDRGWTFTYHCKDSVQQWTRQHAKDPEEPVIGEWYHKEPDPVLDNRPAFDCRGTLTVAFPRNGRAISIKYEHTLVHQTVAQLKELFKPPPRPEPLNKTVESKTSKSAKPKTPRSAKPKTPKDASQASASKTPKTPRPPRTPKAPKTPRTPATGENSQTNGTTNKKRASTTGEGSKPRKRAKKKDGDPPNAGGKDSDSLFVDSNHPTYNTPSTGPSTGAPASAGPSTAQPPAAGPAVSSFPNITAVEAARRKDAANRILTDAGVDPATLSTEQFSIFANQSPELQKDSLAMLVKYGAERLRIVQPTTNASGQQTTSATSSTQPSATGAVTTKELVPQHRNSLPSTPEVGKAQGSAGSASNTPATQMGKSRLVCFQCKERRVKCSKDRPTCVECTKETRSCSYPPQPVRNRSRKKPDATAAQSDNDNDNDDEDEEGDEEGENQAEPEPEPASASNWQMPVAGMLGANVEPTIHNPQPEAPSYYQSATGVPLQHLDNPNIGTDLSAASGLALLQHETHDAGGSIPNPASSLQHQPPRNSQGIDPTAKQNERGSRASMHGSNSSPTPMMANTASSAYPYQTPATQTNTGLGHGRSASAAQREKMQRTASPRAVAASQAPSRASPLQQVESARTTPRQNQRDQTRRPANAGSAAGAPAPATQARNMATAAMSNPLQQQQQSRYAGTQDTSRSANTGSTDTTPYQPYAYGNPSQQARDHATNVAVSGPSAMPSTTASYPSIPSGNQWPRGGTQPAANDRAYSTVNSYIQNANNESSARKFSLRGSNDAESTGSTGQGSQRDYQSFGSHQQQQNAQQQQQQQQNNNGWFGANNANSGGSYNSFGSYWS
ncbi:Zn(2)-C6 fungal-type DNA-binding domain protein [Sarocladium implicatum]|nr:Zn(2)-C6 fungal-type DNA-binding domain protein [Sarocladium implicatum]